MEIEETKKFELNTKVLKNFEKIMSTKLDEIEELKITGLDKSSKLLNIISLCANIKTLIMEGDSYLNSDRILNNIFKPEKLENLILNNVKLPTSAALKRFSNLKMISLNDIRFCNIKDFFEKGITEPQKIEIINISNTDMLNYSVEILQRFTNIKYLSLDHVKNFNLNHLGFLKESKNILKIQIENNKVPMIEINNLLKCKCAKNIDIDVMDLERKIIKDCKIRISEKGDSIITLSINDLKNISQSIDLYRFTKINILINEPVSSLNSIKSLKKSKAEKHIMVKDFACLNVEQAMKIKNILKLESIQFLNGKTTGKYDINTYIEIRTQIDNVLEKIANSITEEEKFLNIYKTLGQEFEIVSNDKLDMRNKRCTALQICQFLQDCLKCIDIKSNIITGDDLENDRKHTWNQVEINSKWYNIDLALDIENIKKNRPEYCLLGDKEFFETHTPKFGKNHYCAENFNQKLIKVYFKTGLFREKLLESYIEVAIEKIKKLFNWNQKQEVLALPEVKINENDKKS